MQCLLFAEGFDGSTVVGSGIVAIVLGLIAAYFMRRDQVIASLNKEIDRLTKRIEDQDKRLYQEEAKTEALQSQVNRQHDQIIILQVTGKQSAFAGWTINTDGLLIDMTSTFERNMLLNMGIKRTEIENKVASLVWPPQFAKALTFLNDEASRRPGHTAAALNVVIHKNLPPMLIAKTVAQYLDGRPYGVQGIAIPMSAFVEFPDGFFDLDEPEKPNP